jgi:hypothetical protein
VYLYPIEFAYSPYNEPCRWAFRDTYDAARHLSRASRTKTSLSSLGLVVFGVSS